METIRVIHHCEDGYWWADSPDVEGFTAGDDSFEGCKHMAEEAIRFALESDDVAFEHYVPAPA